MGHLPELRRRARRTFDALFCGGEEIVPFGKDNVWHISLGVLPFACVVYSGGVGKDISTEKELVQYRNARIELFDPSETGQTTMAKPENSVSGIKYLPVGLAGAPGSAFFGAPLHAEEGSLRKPTSDSGAKLAVATLADLMRERGDSHIDLLKLDIEGFEYEVLDDMLEHRLDVRQICVEFHHGMPGITLRQTVHSVLMLHRAGYRVVYKEMNNFTLVRR